MRPTLTNEQKFQCLRGTFAAEGMQVSKNTQSALNRLNEGKATIDELIRAAISKYDRNR